MPKDQLKHIFYGTELHKIHKGSIALQEICGNEWSIIEKFTKAFFKRPRKNLFGGPITAGDGLFIASFMQQNRPDFMIEIGVASGFSSAFILDAARELDLLHDNRPFLYSFDLMAEHGVERQKTGSFLFESYPEFVHHYKLTTGVTSVRLIEDISILPTSTGTGMAFVDAGHRHPWPSVDLAVLDEILPENTWVLMQDYMMMERWLADGIVHGNDIQDVVRGVTTAVSNWPGDKILGTGLSYNMAAVKTGISPHDKSKFLRSIERYPYECEFQHRDLILRMDTTQAA